MTKVKASLVIITYCQEEVIEAAVDAALAQDFEGLEVVFSDDCSPDRTFEILQEKLDAYEGPHEFKIRQNLENTGILGNLIAAVNEASGDLIVVGAGDDVSLPCRVSRTYDAWIKDKVFCLYSDVWKVTINGERIGRVSRKVPGSWGGAVNNRSYVIGASAAYDRRVFSMFPEIDNKVQYEDVVLYLRALILGQVVHIDEPLVLWTVSPSLWKGSETDALKRVGEKNGRLRSLAYSQARIDLKSYSERNDLLVDKRKLYQVDLQIEAAWAFYQLTQGRFGSWLASVICRPRFFQSYKKSFYRYLRFRGRSMPLN